MAKEKESNNKLQDVLDKLDKIYGKGTVMNAGSKEKHSYDVISTGSLTLDVALGINGLPRGRIVEIVGDSSTGKTTLATHIIAEAQKLGGRAAFIDAEMSADFGYMENLGVDLNGLFINSPSSGEQAIEVLEHLIRTEAFSVIVIDSVSALTPQAMINAEMGSATMGVHARLMSTAMRKITEPAFKSNTLVIFLNQYRKNIGGYGNPNVPTGGEALKFSSSIRLETSRASQVKDGDEVLANVTKVKVLKNKCSVPHKIALFEIVFGEGINRTGEILELSVQYGFVKKSGSWFAMEDGTKLGQGAKNVEELLKDNIELLELLTNKVKKELFK
jgi:recombination protein RecA